MLPRLLASEVGRPHRMRSKNPIVSGMLYQYRQALYDFYGVKANNALTEQTLFQIPIGGQYTPSGGTAFAKTKYHTNMTSNGQLPAPEKHFAKALCLLVRTDIFADDAHRFLSDTVLT